ncbi:DUF2800 domain-containing protein [Candidatus Poriferisocius sp.]|uniref:DUF2800 domain-containing protein n=1 Tax=Candidatus Poriferisocius sp. TaxID=3101276 RepID=UPI003B528CA9
MKIQVYSSHHTRISPSGAHRWLNCPSSVFLPHLGEEGESEAAWNGTLMHAAAAKAIIQRLRPSVMVGATFTKSNENGGWEDLPDTFTPEMAETIRPYVEYCREMASVLGDKEAFVWEVEMPLDFDFLLGKAEAVRGTADFVAWDRANGLLHIVDLKTGHWPVSPVDNPQLMLYAMGAAKAIANADPRFITEPTRRVTFTIVQPKAGGVQSVTVDVSKELRVFFNQVMEATDALDRAMKDPEAHVVEGLWCKFCPAAAACPAKLGNAVEFVELMAQSPQDMGDREVARLLELAPDVNLWIKEAKREAVKRNGVPGWRIAPPRRKRVWKDATAAERYLAANGVKTPIPSPAQAIKKHTVPDDLWHWEATGSQRLVRDDSPFGDQA